MRWSLYRGLAACLLATVAGPAPAHEVVTVGLLANFPPFETWPAAQPAPEGLDPQLLERLGRLAGLRFEFRRFEDFPTLRSALLAGRVQLITATAVTPERLRTMRFTRPYATVGQGLAARRELTSVLATPDLAGRRLAVPRGYATEQTVRRRFPLAPLQRFASLGQALDAVHAGAADLALGALPAIRALINARDDHDLRVLRSFGLPSGLLRLATNADNADLAARLDAALAALPGHELAALHERFLVPLQTPPPEPPAAGNEPPLVVGYDPDDAPHTMRDADGQPDGMAVAIVLATAERVGVKIAGFVPLAPPAQPGALADGRVDLLLGQVDNPDQRASMVFVGPYDSTPLAIVSRKQYSIWRLSDLAGRPLALPPTHFARPIVRRLFPDVQLVSCADTDACLALVEGGGADATLHGLHNAYERLLGRRAGTLRVTGVVVGVEEEHAFALAPARAALAYPVHAALQSVLALDLPRLEREFAARQDAPRLDRALLLRWLLGAAALLLLLLAAWWWHQRRLKREVARTDRARKRSEEYLAFMAHEVRNALQAVAGAVTMLRQEPPAGTRRQPLLDALGQSARSTLGLLNDLLDRHRQQEGRLALAPRPASIETTLAELADETRPAAQAKGLALTFSATPGAAGLWLVDALRVQQVARNLLVNAIKFSDHGTVALTVAAEPDAGRRAEIVVCVADQGAGMDKAAMRRAFDLFETSGGDRAGTGLGLALCRELARALGGTLALASDPGRGTRFTLCFPAERAETAAPEAAGALQRLLIVEDSEVFALLLRQAFEQRGVAVTLAASVAQAREALAAPGAAAYDLVLSDAHLEDGKLADVVALLDEATGTVRPPLIAMSAEFDGDDLVRLEGLPLAATLSKDSDVAAFAARVLAAYAGSRGPMV